CLLEVLHDLFRRKGRNGLNHGFTPFVQFIERFIERTFLIHKEPPVFPKRWALILAMVFAAFDSTRTTRTPTSAPSTSRIAEVMASRSVGAARVNSRKATPLRILHSISPLVASYRASASSGVKSATPDRI